MSAIARAVTIAVVIGVTALVPPPAQAQEAAAGEGTRAAGNSGGDVFPHHRFGEYLVLPNATRRPVKHVFLQFGAGYYEVGGNGRATLWCGRTS